MPLHNTDSPPASTHNFTRGRTLADARGFLVDVGTCCSLSALSGGPFPIFILGPP
jgi:hypothetical protein